MGRDGTAPPVVVVAVDEALELGSEMEGFSGFPWTETKVNHLIRRYYNSEKEGASPLCILTSVWGRTIISLKFNES